MRQKFSRTSRTFFVFNWLKTIGRPLYYLLASGVFLLWLIVHRGPSILIPIFHLLTNRFSVLKYDFRKILVQTFRTFAYLRRRFSLPRITTPKIPLPSVPQFFTHKLITSVFTLVVTFVVISSTTWLVYDFIFQDLPSPLEVSEKEKILTTHIYDRHGQELYSIYKDENRTLVPLEDLPPYVIQATVAMEDASFFQHPGFSIKGIVRAIKVNLTEGKIHGGSTITQQLVKNILLSSTKTYQRKIREILLAIAVDALYTKQEILSMYFNQISYGGTTYGIEQASLTYFGKHARNLDLAEAALLAGIPSSPTAYSPFGNTPELAFQRQHDVLRRMAEEHYISNEHAIAAMEKPIQLKENRTDILAPHFVMHVREILAEKYGEAMVAQGGLEVYTTLDYPLQEQTQSIVTEEIDQLKNFKISNGAALVTEPATGEILAMVGSRDYFDIANDGQVNITERLRQPGSSIKPLTYSIALENGMTPASIILDAPITYHVAGSPPYSPVNYDGKFHGPVRLREALANSYNVPAVKTLSVIGVNKMIDKAELMGIDTWQDRSRFGLSLTLGGGDVRMTDMAEMYGTFANQGQTVDLNPLLLVKDAHGSVLYENPCVTKNSCPSRRSLDPRVAYQITDILSDNQARSAAFGTNSVLNIPGQQVAVKTGTTNNLRDNWTIGYTSNRVVVVWVGNNDNSSMSYVASGITGASPIWNKIISTQLNEDHPHVFAPPDNLIKLAICTKTGTLTCDGCPTTKEEYFLPGTEPTDRCVAGQFQKKEEREVNGQSI